MKIEWKTIVMWIFWNINDRICPPKEFAIHHLQSQPSEAIYFGSLTTERITNIIMLN